MKKVLTLLIAVSFLGTLSAQSAKDIIDDYLENIGGVKKWEAVETMKTTANMSMQGMSFDAVIFAKQPNKQRVEVDINGTQLVQAYDGETAWWINPMMGSTEAQEMPPQMAESMTNQEFETPFLNYKDKGHSVELLGEKEVDGTAVYEIRLGKKNGNVEIYYFDKETMLPLKMMAKGSGPNGQEQTVETVFSDYKDMGDGMVTPHTMEVKMNGSTVQQITFKEIMLNEELKDDLFAFPGK